MPWQALRGAPSRGSPRSADAHRERRGSEIAADDLSRYGHRPYAFIARYLRRRPISHAAILAAVTGAGARSVTTQTGVKFLVAALAAGPQASGSWPSFAFQVALLASDNLLWRVASWIASGAFTA